MAISTLDDVLAGMQPLIYFSKVFKGAIPYDGQVTFVPGLQGIPAADLMTSLDAYKQNNNVFVPYPFPIVSSSVANPTTITVTSHPWSNGDIISIRGHRDSVPNIDGIYTITKTGTHTFTIPVNVTVSGTDGVACGKTGAGGAGLTGWKDSDLRLRLPFTNPSAGKNTYLARFQAQIQTEGSMHGVLFLCDLLWRNSGIDSRTSTEQLFTNSVKIPPRDINGTDSGDGVCVGLVSITENRGDTNIQIKYTNSKGESGKIATNMYEDSRPIENYPGVTLMRLAPGDTGVQKAESITAGLTQFEMYSVILYRVIARLELTEILTTAQVPNSIDALTSGFPQIYNDSVLFLLFLNSQTTDQSSFPIGLNGNIVLTQA